MISQLVTAPTCYPVTLAEAKAHLKVTWSEEDAIIYALIRAATEKAEQYTGRKLVYQTHKLFLEAWTGDDPNRYFTGGFYLPWGTLQSVTHIKYTDTDDDQETWDSSTEYEIDTDSDPGRVMLAYNKSFPTAALRPYNPIEIQFVCGWYHGPIWSAETTQASGDIVRSTDENGLAYQAGGAGATHADTEPTWPTTIGDTVVDNAVTWTCIGPALPFDIRAAILLWLQDLYDIRQDQVIGVPTANLRAAEGLLSNRKIWWM